MRISPNRHPIARLRNILMTVASLLTIWLLLCLTSCATPAVTDSGTSETGSRRHESPRSHPASRRLPDPARSHRCAPVPVAGLKTPKGCGR